MTTTDRLGLRSTGRRLVGIPEIAPKWAATTTSDATTRMALLREIFASGGSYVDPSDEQAVVGYDALGKRVAGMLWEGAFLEAAAWTPEDSHHDDMRLRWRLCDGDAPGLVGTDFVELDVAGRFLARHWLLRVALSALPAPPYSGGDLVMAW